MTQDHPLVERYLTHFAAALAAQGCPDRDDIVEEIRHHIADARTAGRPLDGILEALGPADALARAYTVELLLNPPNRLPMKAAGRFFKVAGVIAASSIATLIVVAGLGSVGIGFSVSGLAVFLIGVLEASEIHLPGVQMNGIPPIWAIVIGPALLIIGVAALIALGIYVRFIVRTLRRVLPRAATTAYASHH